MTNNKKPSICIDRVKMKMWMRVRVIERVDVREKERWTSCVFIFPNWIKLFPLFLSSKTTVIVYKRTLWKNVGNDLIKKFALCAYFRQSGRSWQSQINISKFEWIKPFSVQYSWRVFVPVWGQTQKVFLSLPLSFANFIANTINIERDQFSGCIMQFEW